MIDPEIIKECREGNLSSFRKLIEKTTPFAFSVAFRMLGDEDNAKDVVQETMVAIWQKIERLNSVEGYKTWACRIVVNKCYDELRRRKNNPVFSPDDHTWGLISETISDGASATLEKEETARIINFLTEKLSPKQKAVFILAEIEQMSNEEISSATGMGKQLVKANLHYARKNISEMIRNYYKDGNRNG